MKKLLVAVVVLALAAGVIYRVYPRPPKQAVLRMYAGAGLRPATEKLIAAFEADTGIKVEADYGGSGLIISRAREDKTLDLFLPGEELYVDQLHQFNGRVARRAPIAWFVPTLIVARGNPLHVRGLADLARNDLRVGLGKPSACEIGRVSAAILSRAGVDLSARQPKESLTVNELGVWVKMKDVDVAIVWDAIAVGLGDDVEVIPIPPQQNMVSRVVLASLSTSMQPDAAAAFLKFVQGPRGRQILERAGYRVNAPPSSAPSEPAP